MYILQEVDMGKHLRRLAAFLTLTIIAVACALARNNETYPYSTDQVATTVAMTLQALAPQASDSPAGVPASSTSLLPQSLYFLGNDSHAISQIYRMEREGKTKMQLTFEPVNVVDYDVSLVDGTIAYVAGKQLLLANADGSNRRVLVDEGQHPIFSPDGQTLVYHHGGLTMYNFSTGISNLVIQDQIKNDGQLIPIETYSPERYSPDGKKLLVALGHWELMPSHAVYYPDTNALVRYEETQDYIYCCSFHGGPVWSPDSSSFYGVASVHDSSYKEGELWKVDATNGAVIRMLHPEAGTMNLPKELYLAPDGQLYFFFGAYNDASGFFDAPVLELVRSAPDGVTNRTVLRNENFVLMNEALWAPDASFVIVASTPARNWNQDGGVLELYYTDGQSVISLVPFGEQMKWGP
jgi:hypothetical protein